jgi:hypothetical protein
MNYPRRSKRPAIPFEWYVHHMPKGEKMYHLDTSHHSPDVAPESGYMDAIRILDSHSKPRDSLVLLLVSKDITVVSA